MVLKLKTFINGQKGWRFIDNIHQSTKHEVEKKREHYPTAEATIVIENIEGAQNGEGADYKAHSCIEIDAVRTLTGEFQTLLVYTELPAYLLNDKGETIERLN